MARRRKPRRERTDKQTTEAGDKGNKRGGGRREERAGANAMFPSNLALGDIAATPLGLANINRTFQRDSALNGPSVVWRKVTPYAAFTYGFTKNTTTPDEGPTTDFTSTSVAAGTAFTPRTNYAYDYEKQLYPLLQNIFSSGLGARVQGLDFSNISRVVAMTLEAYRYMRFIFTLNHMTYHFDWSAVVPFTPITPEQMYAVAETCQTHPVSYTHLTLPTKRIV